MATAEIRGISSEQQQAYQQIAGFFGRAESEFPAAAGQLVNVVGGLVGEQRTTQEKLRDGMANIDVRLALIGDWLKETGADGFGVKLGFGGGAKKAIGKTQVKFPTVSDLIRVSGKVDVDLQKQIPPLLSLFSRQIRGGLDVGLSPRQIVGGLVAESVGSRLSAKGSANLREALNKPLGGHFEWIREALKIPDVAEQPGFKPVTAAETKPAAAPKPLPEASRAEIEFIRKKDRIRQYLTQENGMDFLKRTWDKDKWEHVGVNGSVKRVYRPRWGILVGEEICVRENISDNVTSPMESAPYLRQETKFLQTVKGPHFVRVYAHAPLGQTDSQGTGSYRADSHWELVDFVKGTSVERKLDREHSEIYWPEPLSPAVRLKVVLAACECEHKAAHLEPPAYLTDLKTDAFKVQPNGVVRMIDIQHHSDAVKYSTNTIVTELGRLCLELFPGQREYGVVTIEKAIRGQLDPEWERDDRRYEYSGSPRPRLEEILRASELPDGVGVKLVEFLTDVKAGKLKFDEVPMDLARRILPIADRLEREESQARVDELERQMRAEAARRTEEVLAMPEKPAEVLRRAAFRLVEISGKPASEGRRHEAARALAEFVNKLGELPDGAARQTAITEVLAGTKLAGTQPGKFVSRILMTAIDCGVNYPYAKGLLGERENIASAEILKHAMFMILSSDSLEPDRMAESTGENLKLFITSLSGFSDAKARQRVVEEAVKGTRMEGSDPGALVARVFMTAIETGAKL